MRAALLLLVEYAHTPWACARDDHCSQNRTSVLPTPPSPLLYLEKEHFGHLLIGSHLQLSVVPQQGGVFIRHSDVRLHSVGGELPPSFQFAGAPLRHQ